MRAAVLTGWRQPLEIAEMPDPACPPDGVVLRVVACGVCRDAPAPPGVAVITRFAA